MCIVFFQQISNILEGLGPAMGLAMVWPAYALAMRGPRPFRMLEKMNNTLKKLEIIRNYWKIHGFPIVLI